MIKEALVLAGGLGTRLTSVTEGKIPKPLVEVKNGITMLDLTVQGLIAIGVETIVLSLSHLSDQVEEYIDNNYRGWKLDVIKEEYQMGTGGSVVNFINKGQNSPFLLTPADNLITWNDMSACCDDARVNECLAIWVTTVNNDFSQVPNNVWSDVKTSRVVGTTSGRRTADQKIAISNKYSGDVNYANSTSAGLLAINSKEVFNLTHEKQMPYCMYKDLLPNWVDEGREIIAFLTNSLVIDMGTPERLELVRKILAINDLFRQENVIKRTLIDS